LLGGGGYVGRAAQDEEIVALLGEGMLVSAGV
jgi:hypothetical protein